MSASPPPATHESPQAQKQRHGLARLRHALGYSLAGLRAGGIVDRVGLVAAAAMRALPPFVIGLAFMIVFAVWLDTLYRRNKH